MCSLWQREELPAQHKLGFDKVTLACKQEQGLWDPKQRELHNYLDKKKNIYIYKN